VTGSDLAFGSSVAGGIVGTVLISIALIFLGIIAAVVLFIVRLTRSRRARAQGY
jgi:ABC-type amino acid transport system permease subunit